MTVQPTSPIGFTLTMPDAKRWVGRCDSCGSYDVRVEVDAAHAEADCRQCGAWAVVLFRDPDDGAKVVDWDVRPPATG